MESLYIVMPAYNEEDNIESVIRQWYPLLEGKGENSRLVIADSGCSDNTHNIILRMQKEGFSKLKAFSKGDKQHGPKVLNLYRYAIRHGADYIFQTDSDGQTNPAEFDKFWELRKENDAVIAYRPVRGDGEDRKFVENVVCLLVRLFFGVHVKDANAPFRLMKSELVDKYIGRFPKNYNIPNIIFTTFFVYYNEKVTFLPITFKPRQGGKNSIDVKAIVKIGLKALGDFMRFRKGMR
ncbi:MAG: glycosyltransferase family 2 protein [Lachnospiraceae bacterium]|nr:glycosyltransferase family 2 protein [Lachnospiraceae bacterium]